jgi:hypothetical protein
MSGVASTKPCGLSKNFEQKYSEHNTSLKATTILDVFSQIATTIKLSRLLYL